MKNRITFILLGFLLFSSAFTWAQDKIPQFINYQTIVRSSNGEVLDNQAVKFRFSIGYTSFFPSPSFNPLYTERRPVTTNSYGLVAVTIGRLQSGVVVDLGNFKEISWESYSSLYNALQLKVEIDPAGGDNFTALGVMDLATIPYAFHANTAKSAENIISEEITRVNFSPAGFVKASDAGSALTLDNTSLYTIGDDDYGMKMHASSTGDYEVLLPLDALPSNIMGTPIVADSVFVGYKTLNASNYVSEIAIWTNRVDADLPLPVFYNDNNFNSTSWDVISGKFLLNSIQGSYFLKLKLHFGATGESHAIYIGGTQVTYKCDYDD